MSRGRAGTKITVSPMKRGRKTFNACPNMWERGRVERNRSSPSGRIKDSRLRKARSMRPKSEARLPWVRTTPFGSPVVPEVKTISARRSGSQEACTGGDQTEVPPQSPISRRGQTGGAEMLRGAISSCAPEMRATSKRKLSGVASSSGTATALSRNVASSASTQSALAGPWIRTGVPGVAPVAARHAAQPRILERSPS